MKRDMELIRKLILRIEDHPSGWAPSDLTVEGYSREQIGYHCYLIVASGLAAGADITSLESDGPECRITHLTAAGHDFAESSRNQYIWDEVMGDIREKGFPSVAIDLVKKLLDKAVRRKLEAD